MTDARTMGERLAESAAPERFRAIVTGTLAGLALLLAVVGLHGVVSYAVTQRTREIGIRLALGQRPAAVVGLIVFETLRTVAAGAVPGVLASVYAGQWLSSVVMVNADRTAALSAVVAIFTAAALVAAAGPAWRASRVDPVVNANCSARTAGRRRRLAERAHHRAASRGYSTGGRSWIDADARDTAARRPTSA